MSKTVTIVLLVLYVLGAGVLAFFGLFLGMASDSCGSGARCDLDQIGWGVVIASFGQVLAVIVVLVWTIVRMARGRHAWWVPLVGAAASAGLLVGGAALAFNGASAS